MNVNVKVIKNFKDLTNKGKQRFVGDEYECSIERAKFLFENGAVDIIENNEEKNLEEEKPEEVKLEEVKPKTELKLNKPTNKKKSRKK